jgi:hypothetical protein
VDNSKFLVFSILILRKKLYFFAPRAQSEILCVFKDVSNPLSYDVFRGAQPVACGLFGPTELTTLSVLKTILMT